MSFQAARKTVTGIAVEVAYSVIRARKENRPGTRVGFLVGNTISSPRWHTYLTRLLARNKNGGRGNSTGLVTVSSYHERRVQGGFSSSVYLARRVSSPEYSTKGTCFFIVSYLLLLLLLQYLFYFYFDFASNFGLYASRNKRVRFSQKEIERPIVRVGFRKFNVIHNFTGVPFR